MACLLLEPRGQRVEQIRVEENKEGRLVVGKGIEQSGRRDVEKNRVGSFYVLFNNFVDLLLLL